MADLVPRVFVRRLDRRAGERVVELIEEEQLPGLGERVARVRLQPERDCHDAPLLRALEEVLGATVPALDARVRRVAAARVVLQLAAQRRVAAVRGRKAVEEPAQRARLEPRPAVALAQRLDLLQVRDRRPAAVIPDAVEDGPLPGFVRERRDRLVDVLADVVLRRAVLVRDPVGEHARAVGRLPPEDGRLERLLLRPRPQEDVRVAAALGEDLRNRRVVAEGVEVRARRRGDAELLLQVALPVQRLADERLAARDVAVRLDPPPADDLEPAVGDARADLLEQLWVALLHPCEEERRVHREDELGVLVEALDRRPEGRPHLLIALWPLPQPHRIDVRIADHVKHPSAHAAAHSSTCSSVRWSSRTCISWTRAVESDGTISAWSA